MLTIWGRRNSANVQKVLWLADELGLPWHNEPAGGPENSGRHHELMARNPNGLVPVMEQGDLTLWESNAILRHLARLQPDAGFHGQSLIEAARIDQWMDWQMGTLWPPMLPFFIGLARTPAAERDEAVIDVARRRCYQNFSILERFLRPGECIVGSRLTIADMALAPFIHRWLTLNQAAAETQPLLAALYERYQASEAFREHVCRQPFS